MTFVIGRLSDSAASSILRDSGIGRNRPHR